MSLNNTELLLLNICNISIKAGKKILEYYENNNAVFIKEDNSPLTNADISSNKIIIEELKKLQIDTPILSEETLIDWNERKNWNTYWLIDPLDGTKEFLKRNGEFTVNIALIENNTPILGVIYVPVTKEIFWGSASNGSFYSKGGDHKEKLNVSKKIKKPLTILASKSHHSEQLDSLLNQIKDYNLINKGSSLKFCLVALGKADIYLRLGPTSEWDTAAGEAIITFANGHIVNTEGLALKYNSKESFLNPHFIVSIDQQLSTKL